MWIFPNLPQNVDKIPNSKGPGPCTKNGCDGPGTLASEDGYKTEVMKCTYNLSIPGFCVVSLCWFEKKIVIIPPKAILWEHI